MFTLSDDFYAYYKYSLYEITFFALYRIFFKSTFVRLPASRAQERRN